MTSLTEPISPPQPFVEKEPVEVRAELLPLRASNSSNPRHCLTKEDNHNLTVHDIYWTEMNGGHWSVYLCQNGAMLYKGRFDAAAFRSLAEHRSAAA